jgi:heme-degrading monooxygenase HmoA
MYVILWRFRILAGHESAFEDAYGPSGEWALLFRKGSGYLGTQLLRHHDGLREYLTLDRWVSRDAYETFQDRFGHEYQRLDSQLEGLTEEETPLGAFEVVP